VALVRLGRLLLVGLTLRNRRSSWGQAAAAAAAAAAGARGLLLLLLLLPRVLRTRIICG
jgi:hypothetical protein